MHEERNDLEGNEKYCDGFISLCLPSMVSRLWQKPVNIWAIPTLRVRFMRWRRNLHQSVNVQTDADSAKYSGRFIVLQSFLSLCLVTWNHFNLRWAFSRLYVSVVLQICRHRPKYCIPHVESIDSPPTVIFFRCMRALTPLTVTAEDGLTFPIASL